MDRNGLPLFSWILHTQEDPGSAAPPFSDGLYRVHRPLQPKPQPQLSRILSGRFYGYHVQCLLTDLMYYAVDEYQAWASVLALPAPPPDRS